MFDETQNKIIDATMSLVMEKGYTSTTTKDIAKKAEVNECTIFRRFGSKKEIIAAAMTLPEWNPCLREEDFESTGDLIADLCSFSEVYLRKVTPRMVRISIGLRSPDLYELTRDGIREVPDTFKKVLVDYFTEMQKLGKLQTDNIESLAVSFLAVNFGFVFFKASFGDGLTALQSKEYIESSVRTFVNGIGK
ncbi:MAG: TetR/AcrR family transcriptional regulator [Lachnospiraceae bacterium]|nr:TetR/AcrR family transcriptional regulator [Lachnospiraceae bacterium]